MHLSQEDIDGIGIALNEATLLGAEVDPERALAGLTFSVLSLPLRATCRPTAANSALTGAPCRGCFATRSDARRSNGRRYGRSRGAVSDSLFFVDLASSGATTWRRSAGGPRRPPGQCPAFPLTPPRVGKRVPDSGRTRRGSRARLRTAATRGPTRRPRGACARPR
jgi:hypothetical protein